MFNLMDNSGLVSGLSLPYNIQGTFTALKSGPALQWGLLFHMTEYQTIVATFSTFFFNLRDLENTPTHTCTPCPPYSLPS